MGIAMTQVSVSTFQEHSKRQKAARDRQQTGSTPEGQACSLEGLPCLPAFELWLQAEPGKAEARLDRSDGVQEAISAYEQSSEVSNCIQSMTNTLFPEVHA